MGESSHLNAKGEVHMVDISEKSETLRFAHARANVLIGADARRAIQNDQLDKGELWATARLAGIMAAKRTSELIPLCHPLPLTSVELDLHLNDSGLVIDAKVKTHGQTGVEMEALTAASIAALTTYDMLKSIEQGIEVSSVSLVKKSGGRRGAYRRDTSE